LAGFLIPLSSGQMAIPPSNNPTENTSEKPEELFKCMDMFNLPLPANHTLANCDTEQMTCGVGFYCNKVESCEEYSCMKDPDGDSDYECECGVINFDSEGKVGTACRPKIDGKCEDDTEPMNPFAYDCEMGSEGHLQVSVEVPRIKKRYPYDDRKVTLISGDLVDTIKYADGIVTVFGTSRCEGNEDGDSVVFENVIDGHHYCDLGKPTFEINNGTKWETFEFAVGFDDLVDVDPLGNQIVKRYGKYWNLGCRVKITDTLGANITDASGESVTTSPESEETELSFSLKAYRKSDYTGELPEVIDISEDSEESAKIYIEASVNSAVHNLHIHECVVKVKRTTNDVLTYRQGFVVIEDGCLSTYNDFVEKHFNMSEVRDFSSEMRKRDQFEVDLWDYVDDVGEETTMTIDCFLSACREFDEGEGFCETDACDSDRYREFTPMAGRRRRSTDGDYQKMMSKTIKMVNPTPTMPSPDDTDEGVLPHIPEGNTAMKHSLATFLCFFILSLLS